MSAVDDILQSIPMDQLAQELGTDPGTAQQAAGQAVTALLGGLSDNAQSEQGEQSLAQALDGHAASTLLDGGSVNIGDVDTSDGQKILDHVFGNQGQDVVQALSGASGANQGMIQKLLPILAPIVLAYLAKHMAGGKYGNILGPILAGGAVGSGASVLGQILGQVFGGGAAQQAGAPQAQTAPAASGNASFNQTSNDAGPGGLTMGDDSPSASENQDTAQQTQTQGPGGVLGQILGGLLGGR